MSETRDKAKHTNPFLRAIAKAEARDRYVTEAISQGRLRREPGDRYFLGDDGPMSLGTALQRLGVDHLA